MGILSRLATILDAVLITSALGAPTAVISDGLLVQAGGGTVATLPFVNSNNNSIIVQPGAVNDIVVTRQNTLNATDDPPSPPMFSPQANPRLLLNLVNQIKAGPVSAYITGLDVRGRLVFVQSNGKFYYPTATPGRSKPQQIKDANIAIPLGAVGSTKTVTLPDYITSGRVYFGVGALRFFTVYPSGAAGPTLVQPAANNPRDPSAGVRWGFIELTNNAAGLYANLSNVDFVGLVLGIAVKTGSGSTLQAKGLKPGSLQPMCDTMRSAGAKDGQPWGKLCLTDQSGHALRVLAPQDYLAISGSQKFKDYWTKYIDQVMARYAKEPLTIITPRNGNITCRTVNNNALACNGDNHAYGPPTAVDIFGCNSGPFQAYPNANSIHQDVYPRICAAFNRATLLLRGGNVQPSPPASSYYRSEPNNLYAKHVHALSVDGTGYAFPYDVCTVTTPQSPSLVKNTGNGKRIRMLTRKDRT